jgi:hypothetical protein
VGEAKRRRAENERWRAALSSDEKVIVDAAQRLLTKFIDPAKATGMCYRMTYFLHLYLADKGIQTTPVVGYVNDGSDDVFMSHAWLDYAGKKTDLTLGTAERPDLNPTGDILILDFPIRRARKYTYHLEKSEAAVAVEKDWLKDIRATDIIRHKAEEHEAMTKLVGDPAAIRVYLDGAPDRINYERLVAIIND